MSQVQRSSHAHRWHAQSSHAHDGPQQHGSFESVVAVERQVQVSSAISRLLLGRSIRPSPPETHDGSSPYTGSATAVSCKGLRPPAEAGG